MVLGPIFFQLAIKLKVISIVENIEMAKGMEKELIFMLMETNILACIEMVNVMVMEHLII